jgi:hypothetical protein
MGEQVAKTASNLLPLLGILFGIFAVLIIAAIFLRMRVRKESGLPLGKKRALTPVEMRAGDVITVLGRTFSVISRVPLDSAFSWCCLEGEETPARLSFKKDMSEVFYFPGRGEPEGDNPFPEKIKREEGAYQRTAGPLPVGDDWKVALYSGPADRWLAVEARADSKILWRGKTIPPEGVTILEEK